MTQINGVTLLARFNESRVKPVSMEFLMQQRQQQQQHELVTAAASTSTGRKRSSHSSSPSTSYKKPQTSRPKNYPCKFEGCRQSFADEYNLVMHEHIHLGIKPYSCTWPDCSYSCRKRSDVVRHVRTIHFNLPRFQMDQQGLVVDQQDPNVYLHVDADLANRRL